MANTTFIPKETTIVSSWLQDVNDAVYKQTTAFIAPEVIITGTGTAPPVLLVVPPCAIAVGNTIIQGSGIWTDNFPDTFPGVPETITFSNLTGARQFNITSLFLLTELNVPELTIVFGTFALAMLTSLPTFSAPALTVLGTNFILSNMNLLTTFSLPAIIYIYSAIAIDTNCPLLTTFTLGTGLLYLLGDVLITAPPLNQASVDGILVRLAALDGTAGTTSYEFHTVNLAGNCAVPSATGLAAKVVLEARGNTVTVNV